MKYFTLSVEDFKIIEIFNNLKEIREKYSEIDIVDYMDDLDESFEDKYFVSEEFFSSLVSQSKEEENKSSLRDIISLKEELDEMKEQYNQANIEIETVHGEYVKILESNTKNEELIVEYKKKIDDLLILKTALNNKINKLEETINDLVKEHEDKIVNISKILGSTYKKQFESKLNDLVSKLDSFEKDIVEYEKEV